MVVLDTCALIELCLPKPRLSPKVMAEIDRGAQIMSVSIAEIALKVKLKKLQLDRTPQELVVAFESVPSMAFIAVGVAEWLAAIELKWPHKDPADRLIVAFAKTHGLSIVTSDVEMKRYYKRCIWA